MSSGEPAKREREEEKADDLRVSVYVNPFVANLVSSLLESGKFRSFSEFVRLAVSWFALHYAEKLKEKPRLAEPKKASSVKVTIQLNKFLVDIIDEGIAAGDFRSYSEFLAIATCWFAKEYFDVFTKK